MNVAMRVHSVSTQPVEVEVDYNGDKARAMLPQLEVELMSVDGQHGTWAARFRSQSEITAARALFTQGEVVSVSISKAAPEAIETTAADSAA